MLITDVVNTNEPLSFLVGAGISIEPPAGLAPADSIIHGIIKKFSAPVYRSRLEGLHNIRYEALIQIFQDCFDMNLNILDYFIQDSLPNSIHQFLASMIAQGQFVMTTNFDLLIEKALSKIEVVGEYVSVITPEDYEKYSHPQNNFANNLYCLYKLHV